MYVPVPAIHRTISEYLTNDKRQVSDLFGQININKYLLIIPYVYIKV